VDEYKSKLIRSLKFKCKSLSEEILEANTIYDLACAEFMQSIHEFCTKNNLPNPLNRLIDNPPPDKPEIKAGISELYREIARESHPDKSFHSGPNLDKENLFKEASIAKKDMEYAKLMEVARKLKIDDSSISYDIIEALEKEISVKEKKIHSMRTSYPWAYYYADNNTKGSIIKSWYECNKCR
jgi:hypothetical protein